MLKKITFLSFLLFLIHPSVFAIIITEVMYHPQTEEDHYEYIEIYNETLARRDLGNWSFTDGVRFTFAPGTVLEPHAYLVVAINPEAIKARYGIDNVMGPFTGRLANSSDHIILRSPGNSNGIMAEVDYENGGKWPTSAAGAGHSLSKTITRGDPMDPDNWSASAFMNGTPGKENSSEPWIQETEIIASNEEWNYFKGISEASDPIQNWRQIGFDDSQWLSGPTGIGFGDGDDATILTDMQNNYLTIFCRKTFTITDLAAIDQLMLEIDHDDGFIAYLNGVEVNRNAMLFGDIPFNIPAGSHSAVSNGGAWTIKDISSFKNLLVVGENVLAVQVHNSSLDSSDLTFIPRLVSTLQQGGTNDSSVVARINEVCFHTSSTQFIELYNAGAVEANFAGLYLSNDADNLDLYQLSTTTLVAPGGHVAFTETELGFSIDPKGDPIFLTASNLSRVLDARRVEAGPLDMSEGRWPDGADDWFYMTPTSATANTADLETSIVINEIMYSPPSSDVNDEFIEITNIGPTGIDLTGWSFSRGVKFDFPDGQIITPGQYLVIAKNREKLMALHGLDGANILGNYQGELANADEKIRLRDAYGNTADEVHYYEAGRWPKYADGYGSSLELIDARQDNNNPQAWKPSDETAKSEWTSITYTGRHSPRDTNQLQSEFHMRMMGQGEILIDNLSMKRVGYETDYISNGSFESGMTKWLATGHNSLTYVTTEYAREGTRSLRFISQGRGDTGPNHIEQNTAKTLSSGQYYTVSFWAKWLWGNRVLNTSAYANGVAETHMIPTPSATGTPGAANTALQANLGPVVSDVRHYPVIPKPSDQPLITARVHDPDNIHTVMLKFKADTDASYSDIRMYDDGQHGDGAAGDGLYGANVPPRAAAQTVAFYIESTDTKNISQTWPTDPTRPALYRVENAPLSSKFPTYRLIMTATDATSLDQRPHLSNLLQNCTFIFDETDVYYNAGTRYTGSPFHRSGGDFSGYKIRFNADQKFHGQRLQVRIDKNPGGQYNDRVSYDLQRWMGLPHCLLEWASLRVNQTTHGTWEDTIHPGSREYLDTFFRGDDNGPIHEVNDWYNFPNSNDLIYTGFSYITGDLNWLGEDEEPYRDNYGLRNNDNDDDYTTLVAVLNVLNNVPTTQYRDAVDALIEVKDWCRLMAIRTSISDWDWIGARRGKNCFMYWPLEAGKMRLFGWDSELTFGETGMSIWSDFADVRKFQQFGRHKHYYFHYLKELHGKYFNRENLDSWIDHYNSLVGGGTGAKSFITSRSSYIMNQIPKAIASITTNNGDPHAVTAPRVTLEGTAPVETRWIRVNGILYEPDWTDYAKWVLDLELEYGMNELTLEFLDYDGALVGEDSIQVTAPDASSTKNYLRVSEIHYHPMAPSPAEITAGFDNQEDFQFIELTNASTTSSLDLRSARFTEGIIADLSTSTILFLFPGDLVILAKNPAAFNFRYGSGLAVVGKYGGSLDRGGETIRLVDDMGATIQTFTYDDENGWPPGADGLGYSIEAIDLKGNLSDPANWRASLVDGGTPGTRQMPEMPSNALDALRVTEIHYNPTPPTAEEIAKNFTSAGDFEYIELKNIDPYSVLQLSGIRITVGVPFDFTAAAFPTLSPGEFLILANNQAAFEHRYGTGHPVAGQYKDAQLDNAGEAIRLVDDKNIPIQVFTYDDAAPWPITPDGQGPALEAIDPQGDYNNPLNWRPTAETGGNPGKYDGAPVYFPRVKSLGAANITTASATLPGEVTSTGGENPTVTVYWGETNGAAIIDNWQHSVPLGKLSKGAFSIPIDSLKPETVYYYRARVQNSGGTSWSSFTLSFTTKPPPVYPALWIIH